MLKVGFQKCHHRPQHRPPLSSELHGLLVAASADCFWCGQRRQECDRAMHLAFPTSHCNPVLSPILTHNNPVGLRLETWLANCGDRYVPSIAQGNDSSGISNFMWIMRRSSVMLEIHTTPFIQNSKAHPPKVGTIPPAEFWGTPLL